MFQKEVGSQNFIWIQHISCLQQYLYTRNFGFKETSYYPESVIPKGLWNTMIFMMKEL